MKKNQKVSKENPTFTIGELNIILKIDFRDEDLEIKDNSENSSEKQFHKLEELTEIKSLSFLHKKEEILKRFRLETKNEMLKLLLIGSKNMEKQGLIDYICFNIPRFEEDEEYYDRWNHEWHTDTYHDYQDYGNGRFPRHLNFQTEFGASLKISNWGINCTYSQGLTNHNLYDGYKTYQNKLNIGLSYTFDAGSF